ncbi:Peptidase M23 [Caulobacteraceae bacterium]
MLLVGGAGSSQPSGAQSQSNDPIKTVKFALPIACEIGRNCEVQNYVDRDPSIAAKDYMCGSASYNDHSGVDFRIPDMAAQRRGVDVLAAAPGRVSRVRDGVADVSVKLIDRRTIEGRECGNGVVIDHGGGLTTQYCHMANGSIVVANGTEIRAGQKIGQVGLSGNTEYPHLHFTVRSGQANIDPFAPLGGNGNTCGAGNSMWKSDVATSLSYKPGAILNVGFATSALTMEQVEAGNIASPTRATQSIVAYVRTINLKVGDVQQFMLKAPDGGILASHAGTPIAAPQAQHLVFMGKNHHPLAGRKVGTVQNTSYCARAVHF